MNNLSFSDSSSNKGKQKGDDNKNKKKIDYSKEITDLQKIYDRIKEKYNTVPNTRISNAMIDLSGSIDNLKRFEY
jgi:hypothetical protein